MDTGGAGERYNKSRGSCNFVVDPLPRLASCFRFKTSTKYAASPMKDMNACSRKRRLHLIFTTPHGGGNTTISAAAVLATSLSSTIPKMKRRSAEQQVIPHRFHVAFNVQVVCIICSIC
jgi:hypothetical protein